VKAPLPGPSSTTLDAACKSDARTISSAKNGDEGHIAPKVEGSRRKDLKKPSDMTGEGSFGLRRGATSKDQQLPQN
jgi:hypothetical protein